MLKTISQKVHRPWGSFEILSETKEQKIKRIIVHPGKRLSLQLHHFRSERWTILAGRGVVQIGEDRFPASKGKTFFVPLETVHRIENVGDEDLIFEEVQTGTYFGEDDIVRLEDDWGRV